MVCSQKKPDLEFFSRTGPGAKYYRIYIEIKENLIKKGAKKLSDVTDEVVDNFKNSDVEFNTQTVFEIAIKVLFALIALAILKIPFYIKSTK